MTTMERCETRASTTLGAGLPVLYVAAALFSVGLAGQFAGSKAPTTLVAPASPVAYTPMSPREEARLAAELSAFALAKVAPERPEAEAMQGPPLDPLRFATPRAQSPAHALTARKAEKSSDRSVKVAAVLPPQRPAVLSAAPAVVATPTPATPGMLQRVAGLVPTPREVMDGAWSVGGRLASYVPRF